jgi:hypothetical protein
VVGDVDMHEFSPVVPKDQEPEEQAEGEGGDADGRGEGRRMYLATVSPATS